jgi:hypothetical protein
VSPRRSPCSSASSRCEPPARAAAAQVPGIVVPDHIQEALRAAGPDGPKVGMALARELVEASRSRAEGVYLVAPFRRPLGILELLADAAALLGSAGSRGDLNTGVIAEPCERKSGDGVAYDGPCTRGEDGAATRPSPPSSGRGFPRRTRPRKLVILRHRPVAVRVSLNRRRATETPRCAGSGPLADSRDRDRRPCDASTCRSGRRFRY